MKRLRKIIFWGHLTAGALAGLVILVMSVTGVLLAFQTQIINFAERGAQTAQTPRDETSRLGPRELLMKAREARPDINLTGLTLRSDPAANAAIMLGRDGLLYINPYTGDLPGGEAKRTRAFLHAVEDWHRWLGAGNDNRALARAVTGACNAAFLVLAMTGVYLWWPKKWVWRTLRPVILFKRGLSGRARDFNWHNVIGFWSSWVLILLTATGLVMSYQWANNLLYTLTGSPPPPVQQQGPPGAANPANPDEQRRTAGTVSDLPTNLDQLWLRAEGQTAGWQAITLRLPARADTPLTFSIREGGTWNPLATSTLTLNPATVEVVKWESYAGLSLGRRLRSWVRATHTGEAGRWPGQLIALAASLGGSLLVCTGLLLSMRRFRSWVSHRNARGRVMISTVVADGGDR